MLQFTSEIINDVLFRAGESTDGSSDYASAALDYVNRGYRAIWLGGGEFVPGLNEPWLWLKKDPPGVIILQPPVNAGSLAVTQNSASITFSSAPAASQAGNFLQVTGFSDIFRILTHNAGSTAATIDGPWTGTTAAAAAYNVYQLGYSLAADVLRLIAPMRVQADTKAEIEGCDLNSLDRDFPLTTLQSGTPTRYAMVTEAKVRFNRYVIALTRVEYDYLQKPADLTNSPTEQPLVPLEFRQVLADIALYFLYLDKSDQRADSTLSQAKAGLASMAMYNRHRVADLGRETGKLITRPTQELRRERVPRTSSGFIIG